MSRTKTSKLNICQNPECAVEFKVGPGSNGLYCSPICGYTSPKRLKGILKRTQKQLSKYLENPKLCLKCNKVIDYKHKANKFCSKSCAFTGNQNRYTHGNFTKKAYAHRKSSSTKIPTLRIDIECLECKEHFFVLPYQGQRKYCSRICSNKNSYHPNSTRVNKSVYNGYDMDSGAEEMFAKLLDRNNIKWIKNKTIFYMFIDSQQKQRKYYPDFYLPDYDLWVEIKGKKYVRFDDHLRYAVVPKHLLLFSNNILHSDTIENIKKMAVLKEIESSLSG